VARKKECHNDTKTQKHKVVHRRFRFVGKVKTKKNLMKYDNELLGHFADNHFILIQS